MILFFDIETICDENHEQDETKLMEKYWEERINFLPEITKIFTICCWLTKDDWEIFLKNIEWTEKEQIEKFFDLTLKYTLCWFNILNFDLPFIIKRALHYGIKIPHNLKMYWKKPWEMDNIIDLQDVYRYNVWGAIWNLDLICKHLNIETPKDTMCWSEVQEYFNKWKTEEIKRYCEQDVLATMQVYDKFNELNLM